MNMNTFNIYDIVNINFNILYIIKCIHEHEYILLYIIL